MIGRYEESGALSHNGNFKVDFDMTINSLILSYVELSFTCLSD